MADSEGKSGYNERERENFNGPYVGLLIYFFYNSIS